MTGNTAVLYWLNRQASYNQFLRNRFNKILESDDINWQYVPMREDPADLGSSGSLLTKAKQIWWTGPSWLQVKENWPRQPDIKPSEESEKEVEISKEHKYIVFTTVAIQDDFDLILHKFDLHKALRISAWILRFINNRKNKKSGPLATAELVNQKKFYIKREQEKVVSSDRFEDNKKRLNLEKNDEEVLYAREDFKGFILSTYHRIQY